MPLYDLKLRYNLEEGDCLALKVQVRCLIFQIEKGFTVQLSNNQIANQDC